MMETGHIGKMLIAAGVIMAVVGIVLVNAGRIPWLGRLPGDICLRKEQCTFYLPLATSLLISIVLSLVLYLWNRR